MTKLNDADERFLRFAGILIRLPHLEARAHAWAEPFHSTEYDDAHPGHNRYECPDCVAEEAASEPVPAARQVLEAYAGIAAFTFKGSGELSKHMGPASSYEMPALIDGFESTLRAALRMPARKLIDRLEDPGDWFAFRPPQKWAALCVARRFRHPDAEFVLPSAMIEKDVRDRLTATIHWPREQDLEARRARALKNGLDPDAAEAAYRERLWKRLAVVNHNFDLYWGQPFFEHVPAI